MNTDEEIMADLLGEPREPALPISTIEDLIAESRKLLDGLPKLPDRIRLTEMVPEGDGFLFPFEWDGSAPGPDRCLTDHGPHELCIHPATWERILGPVVKDLEESRPNVPVPMPEALPLPAVSDGWRYKGIPVIDGTLKVLSASTACRP